MAILLASPIAAQDLRKPRISVVAFEDKSTSNIGWGRGRTSGEAIADMMVTELYEVGRFEVIEREGLAQLLAEQELGVTGLLDPDTATEFGGLHGIDFLVIGSITEAGFEQKAAGLSRKASLKTLKAIVHLDVRLVSLRSGKVVLGLSEEGTTSRRGFRARVDDEEVSGDDTSDTTMIGKAARKAVSKIVKEIGSKSDVVEMVAPISWRTRLVTRKEKGSVYVDEEGYVYLEDGALEGINDGDRLLVQRSDPELSVPIPKTVAELVVVDSSIDDGQSSKCRVVEGSASKLQKNDVVRRAKSPS